MSAPVWRGYGEENPLRRFIRANCLRPSLGPDGRALVAEDLDLVTRVYTQRDHVGRFRLIEVKTGGNAIGTSKERTFGLIDSVARAGDPMRCRYDGYYLVRLPAHTARGYDPEWDPFEDPTTEVRVEGARLGLSEFVQWLNFDGPTIAPHRFGPNRPVTR